MINLIASASLLPNGSHHIDFEESPFTKEMCSDGYTLKQLQPNKKCKDRFLLSNGILMPHPSVQSYWRNRYERKNTSFGSDVFCIEINGEAKSKEDHFARVCVKDDEQMTT